MVISAYGDPPHSNALMFDRESMTPDRGFGGWGCPGPLARPARPHCRSAHLSRTNHHPEYSRVSALPTLPKKVDPNGVGVVASWDYQAGSSLAARHRPFEMTGSYNE